MVILNLLINLKKYLHQKGEYNSTTIELINRLYNENYTWESNLSNEENKNAGNTWPEFEWLGNNVGSKWI